MTNTIRLWLSIQRWVSVRWGYDALRVLGQQTRATLKHLQLIFGLIGPEGSSLNRSAPWSPLAEFCLASFFWDCVRVAVRGHTCPGSHPKSQNVPIHSFVVFQETRGVKRSCRCFCSHFWKWRLLWVGSMVSQVLWALGVNSGLKSLTKFQDNAKTKGGLLLKNKQITNDELGRSSVSTP